MRVTRGLAAFRPSRRRTAVAIGNFDGVHLGHARVLARLRREAASSGLTPLVLTFLPHPKRIPGRGESRMLQTGGQKFRALAGLGLRNILTIALTPALAALSPEAFATGVLAKRLRARTIVVGRSFRFGRNRAGSAVDLRRLGRRAGFKVVVVPPVRVAGRIASSTLIRRALERGDVTLAAKLLGRPYEIEGTVVRGRGRGRSLGFPTANLATRNEILPRGVYATAVVIAGRPRLAMTNVGTGPTFGGRRLVVESSLLDYDGALRGRKIAVRFLKRLRPERKFPSREALVRQLLRDAAETRRIGFEDVAAPPRNQAEPSC